jgi:hypothetical protein
MKISLFLSLPLFGFSLILVLRGQRASRSRLLALAAMLLVLSAPWYLRNFIAVGDPIPPTLNLMLRGRDKIFTAKEYQEIRAGLDRPGDAAAFLSLPLDLFRTTESTYFREPGVNLSMVFLYLPFATLFLMIFTSYRKRVGVGLVYLNLAVIYLLVLWLGISTSARFALHFFPVYLGFLGICFNFAVRYVESIAEKKRVTALTLQTALPLLLLALLVPSPTSNQFYGSTLLKDYLQLPERLKGKEDFLIRYQPGYVSTQTTINSMYTNGNQHQRVLAVGFEYLSFYFRERNMVSVGDWFGPGRYSDLWDAINNSELGIYLTRFEIGAVIVNLARDPMSKAQHQNFIRQLELSHFKLQPPVERSAAVYLKTD